MKIDQDWRTLCWEIVVQALWNEDVEWDRIVLGPGRQVKDKGVRSIW